MQSKKQVNECTRDSGNKKITPQYYNAIRTKIRNTLKISKTK